MAKAGYIGINNIARKIKSGYVSQSEIARKIKKGYIGVGGVARPFWTEEELNYYGEITPLSVARYGLAATSIGNYVLFGGGAVSGTGNTGRNDVDSYDSSLTLMTLSGLSQSGKSLKASSVGDYALFAGAQGYPGGSNLVTTYDCNLTKGSAPVLNHELRGHSSSYVGNYALFAGYMGSVAGNYGNAYDGNLTKYNINLSQARGNGSASSVGNYALFAGGWGWKSDIPTAYSTVDVFNESLTRTLATQISTPKRDLAGANLGEYALFAGGADGYGTTQYSTLDCYNSNLTKISVPDLDNKRKLLSGFGNNNYAIFLGGIIGSSTWNEQGTGNVDLYTKSLTKIKINDINTPRGNLDSSSINNWILFGGGGMSSAAYNTVDAFKF